MSSMKIGIVCYPTVGGSGVIATEMAMHAAHAGHEAHLISYHRPTRVKRAIPGLRCHDVQVSAYPLFRYPPYDLALATRMLEVQESEGVDLFHVHYAIPHAISAYLARVMGGGDLRFITTLHGTDITVVGAERAYTRPTRFAIDQSNAVTAVSRYLADETMLMFGSRKEIEVVPNFVDTARFKPGNKGRYYQRDEDERVIVHASNFRPVKRIADVVRAFSLISAKVPARLQLAGDGPDREHALAVAGDLGCADRVEFLGNTEDIESVLEDADLFLSASESESFGLSMLEAMSCGVPCVSTDVGGVSEVLGSTGALTSLTNPEEMATAALRLLESPELHAENGRKARERAEACFSQDSVMDQYYELYERVLQS
ncbi:MAG: N-acetyl-alpha-D-glucosaminyl L-malate synthase BshA [Planctomycetota bacterium]|jgi:N-acetyl-alpha-D-glucosaminyl L-malate synthase BshA